MSTPRFRTDHVSSFLRPAALIEARAQFKAGEIDATALRALEDAAIRDIVAFQEGLGLMSLLGTIRCFECSAANCGFRMRQHFLGYHGGRLVGCWRD